MVDREPIAIVGIGCRYAGIPHHDALWRLLVAGRHAMKEVPADRFPIDRYFDPQVGTPGKIVTREGGYLDNIRGFDARLFQISHREAVRMDPQQRVLLEVAWQALEDAGHRTDMLHGTNAGVFVGMFTGDYRDRILKRGGVDLDVYTEVGTTRSSTAGRIAHAFNLVGPAVAIDAACASSLVAVHLAAQGIWAGDTEMALAGGVNVILEPDSTISFSKSGMLSPESRCRFGDAAASGFVRAEGAGIVVLKPLSRAIADRDRVYALIRVSASNNDARQGAGLYMTPSRAGQIALLNKVYGRDDLPLDELCYVEAHGTGTRAGDPVECGAIAEAIGRKRQAPSPLYIGSVKSNLGHTEGAAGVTGLIKSALVLYNRLIPPSLHLEHPNPEIPWEAGRLEIPRQCVPLPETGTLLAGVSSFGLSGTNAHVALESPGNHGAPQQDFGSSRATSLLSVASGITAEAHQGGEGHQTADGRKTADRPDGFDTTQTHEQGPREYILPLSAHMPSALRERAAQLRALLSDESEQRPSLEDVCYTAACRRNHLPYRLAVVGHDAKTLAEALEPFAGAEVDEQASCERAACRVAFVFPGQGGQWRGMGQALLDLEPAFRVSLESFDAAVQQQEGWSVLEVLRDTEGPAWQDIARIQPTLLAVQIALADTMKGYGIHPVAAVGHSMGEVAAAYIAGALDLEDAVRVICIRSRLLARIREKGGMAVVGLGVEEAAEAIRGYEARLAIAVSNSPGSTVLSGDPDALEEVLAALTAREIYCRKVDVDVASHSPQVEPLLDDLREKVRVCRPRASVIPFYSTVDAAIRPGEGVDVEYWTRNMRQPVRFAETSQRMIKDGIDIFVEVGPHPVLVHALVQNIRREGAKAIAICPMRRDEQSRDSLNVGLASLYMHGYSPDWERICPPGKMAMLPSYPFQHEEFWLEEGGEEELEGATRRTASGEPAHPLLPRYLQLASTADISVWETPLSTRRFPYLADHRVKGTVLLPGAAYVEMAVAAAQEAFPGREFHLEDVELRDYLAVPSSQERTLQLQMQRHGSSRASLAFYSTESGEDGAPTHLHATALVRLDDLPAGSEDARHPQPDKKTGLQDRHAEAITSGNAPADCSGTADGTVSSEAELAEQLTLELDRRRQNPDHRFALLRIRVESQPDSSDVPAPAPAEVSPAVGRQIAALLRQTDVVYPLGETVFAVLLKRIDHEARVSLVAERIRTLLPDRLSKAFEGLEWRAEVAETAVTNTHSGAMELLSGLLVLQKGQEERLSATFSQADGRHPVLQGVLDADTFYRSMDERSIFYGPAFRAVNRVEYQDRLARAALQLPEPVARELDQYILHPAALDTCLQAAVAAFVQASDENVPSDTFLPVGIRRLAVRGRMAGTLRCRSWYRGQIGDDPNEVSIDFVITDAAGRTILEADELRIKRFERRSQIFADEEIDGWFHRWQWQPLEVEHGNTPENQPGSWLLFEDDHGFGAETARALEAIGARCLRIRQGQVSEPLSCAGQPAEEPSSRDPRLELSDGRIFSSFQALFDALENESLDDLRGVLFLWNVGAETCGQTALELMERSAQRSTELIDLVVQSSRRIKKTPLPLWVVTSGAWQVESDDPSPALDQAPLWGLGRVIANEYPGVALRQADVGPDWQLEDAAMFAALASTSAAEPEIALRNGNVFVHRLVRMPAPEGAQASVRRIAASRDPIALVATQEHGAPAPSLTLSRRRAPAPHEVEIEVEAVALDLAGWHNLATGRRGLGCAGRVATLGEAVRDLAVGDRVTAYVPARARDNDSLLARFVSTSSALVAPIPADLPFEEAASLAGFSLPAGVALVALGRLQPGERLLVQAAGPGIGQAALDIAARLGATSFATAARLESRRRLRDSGVPCVLDHGAPDWVDQLLDMTAHEGVDLALNLCPAPELPQLFATVAAGGRVVSLGLEPEDSGTTTSMNVPEANINAVTLELDALAHRRPQVVGRTLQTLVEWVRDGELAIAPCAHMGIDDIVGHLRREKTTQDGDKSVPTVVRLAAPRLAVRQPIDAETLVRKDASYLISGGTGGLGVALAELLGRHGAGQVVLLSRRGDGDPGLAARLEEVRKTGAGVTVLKADISDEASVGEALSWIHQHLPPLDGVFHLAGVLDDATLERQDMERFRTTMRPKVLGAWHLHSLTRALPLRHFVLFSSAATVLGSPGQANYAAANAFLDALAAARRAEGLPGLSIGWGVWGGVGLAAAAGNRGNRLEARGLAAMSPGQALQGLVRAMLTETDPHVGILAIDWKAWARSFPALTRSPMMAHLAGSEETQGSETDPRDAILTADETSRTAVALEYLRRETADVLGMPPARLSVNTSPSQLGLDSLMTVELHSRLSARLHVELSPTRILGMPDLNGLAALVVSMVMEASRPGSAPAATEEALPVPEEEMVALDPDIGPNVVRLEALKPRSVFLTGATGFVGAHLLHELLERTRAHVHCLVRDEDPTRGWNRLRANLAHYGLWQETLAKRISLVMGDLEAPGFGLPGRLFAAMGESISAIYHCGAWVNHVFPCSRLKAANVLGTQEVLRLAAGRAVRVNHISTIAVFPATHPEGKGEVYEETSALPEHSEPFFAGYGESKLLAERLISEARSRGMKINVFRLGTVTGSTAAAICPQTDAIWRIVQAAAELGVAPALDRGVGLTPVDFVARAIVRLSLVENLVDENFHLFNPNVLKVSEGIRTLRRMGYKIDVVDSETWKRRLRQDVSRTSPIFPMLPKLLEIDLQALEVGAGRVDCTKTMELLTQEEREGLNVDGGLAIRYVKQLVKAGFMPHPTTHAAAPAECPVSAARVSVSM